MVTESWWHDYPHATFLMLTTVFIYMLARDEKEGR